MGMPGSGSGPGKRAGRNPGTAPRADFHRRPISALVEFVDSHKDRFGVEPACAVLELSPSTYYAAKRREESPSARDERDERDEELKNAIIQARERRGRRLYGAKKMWRELNRDGIEVARCTVERLMREMGLEGLRGQEE